ncbi:hypothetical protein BIW11_12382 [Tropilaelaps mercedesae]|uniref:Uncharacterized protein n=1 Tax=Tropilaelaps mercedesae TaxID=418985 RepID=A0A1V9X6L7_9ACAR|nr:hypothetical protein BIW11_12382 [Tropilaelaps mercedesae]
MGRSSPIPGLRSVNERVRTTRSRNRRTPIIRPLVSRSFRWAT